MTLFSLIFTSQAALAAKYSGPENTCAPTGRTVLAKVVALDQAIVYNRFGAWNPNGQIYSLRRDVVHSNILPNNGESIGDVGPGDVDIAGHVNLRPDKRPRPLVLRANCGDILEIHFTNLLNPNRPVVQDPNACTLNPDGVTADCNEEHKHDWPTTRRSSLAISGMPTASNVDASQGINTGMVGIEPGQTHIYRYFAQREGTFLFSDFSAPAGGEGDGGSLTHGLFGSVSVEPTGSTVYRSQVSQAVLDAAKAQASPGQFINYEAVANGDPLINMHKFVENNTYELVHGDLNAIVTGFSQPPSDIPGHSNAPYREFVAIMHGELKTFYPPELVALEQWQLSGVKDGFAFNYGASGLGAMLLANRAGVGPAANCVDCAYEEFFLESWANGDPALLSQYNDDPSNVHHSYQNDRIVFRNMHAGPKETHVFHLHAHQWSSQFDTDKGAYLDSQTIGPMQGTNYPIWWGGSGNRNITPGDSIFHCHLYPHFAQGMWELWRVHDVLEDGTRRLPDGVLGEGTNPNTGLTTGGTPIPALVPMPNQAMPPVPTYLAASTVSIPDLVDVGNTVPVVDLKDFNGNLIKDTYDNPIQVPVNPGFPFYIAGKAGHRSPQAPMDLHNDGGLPRHLLVGGTRDVNTKMANCVEHGAGDCDLFVNKYSDPSTLPGREGTESEPGLLDVADFSVKIKSANLEILPEKGTVLERAAMAFHGSGATEDLTYAKGWKSLFPDGTPGAVYKVNGLDAKPGAPFSDPCPENTPTRLYEVSAIQLDLLVNSAGWHDPQGRINVLDSDIEKFENKLSTADPFFFRVNSGECVEFRHTNRTPHILDVDPFQVETPTDTIGQHIHLVKFDVTASDGAGNGWNYEDGTFSFEAVQERIHATHQPGGSAVDSDGNPIDLQVVGNGYQTTVQRWWADPYQMLADGSNCLDADQAGSGWGCDKTIGTVFTHDHFAPSSIQQHGFYNALVVEPKGSEWFFPNGTRMGGAGDLPGVDGLIDVQGVGTQAIIRPPVEGEYDFNPLHEEYREYMVFSADFALLFERNGMPVDPPILPESISKEHHNPYLINYKHEPFPLRLTHSDNTCDPKTQDCTPKPNLGQDGDMAYVFASIPRTRNCQLEGGRALLPHQRVNFPFVASPDFGDWNHLCPEQNGWDPFTEIYRGYEGDNVRVRFLHGAQEVQQTFGINTTRWRRDMFDPTSIFTNWVEYGISEHFESEMSISPADSTLVSGGGGKPNKGKDQPREGDQMYFLYSSDALWNGTWGLMRRVDPVKEAAKLDVDPNDPTYLAPLNSNSQEDSNGNFKIKDVTETVCPKDPKGRHSHDVYIQAWAAQDLLNAGAVVYNAREGITDPSGLLYLQVTEDEYNNTIPGKVGLDPVPYLAEMKTRYGSTQEPLVLRYSAGECLHVHLRNMLPANVPDHVGDAGLPPITSWKVDDFRPSNRVSLMPQLVEVDFLRQSGVNIGRNGINLYPVEGEEMINLDQTAGPGQEIKMDWYLGRLVFVPDPADPDRVRGDHFPEEFGPVALNSYGDIIKHGAQGLVGTLVVEPEESTITPVAGTNLMADVCHKLDPSDKHSDTQCFRDVVVVYQDGLNLLKDGAGYQLDLGIDEPLSNNIPNCHVCDDSYDLGEKASNYKAEPFWARLGLPTSTDTNGEVYPVDFFLDTSKTIETPKFTAEDGQLVRFRVVQPHGRARQRTFLVYGHDWDDDGQFSRGFPHSSVMAPGKNTTAATIAKEGLWMYRDGPNQHFADGVWGHFEVSPSPAP